MMGGMNGGQRLAAQVARRPALDALRLVVVLGLIFFHSALVFDANDDFYVKNSETTEVTTVLAGLGVVWAMPLLFVVAGIGSRYSMRRRGRSGFARERLLRLGVPLVFATLTIVPVPQYLRLRAADPGYAESYPRFLLRFFDVQVSPADVPFLLQGEHFETGHLWFVVLLLTFSLLLAAAAGRVPAMTGRLAAAVSRPGVILLPGLPVAAVCAVRMEEGLGAWSRWAYLLFFLYGFVLAGDARFDEAIRRHARVAAVLGVLLFAASAPAFVGAEGDPLTDAAPLSVAGRVLFGLSGWCCLVAILGLLDRARPAGPPPDPAAGGRAVRVYRYLGTAALPIYVLHQPIVVAVAYAVVRWEQPVMIEYAAIVAASLVLTLAAYDLLVRRTRVTRFLFGMRAEGGTDAGRG
jgi:peptidoglycan/LPS O-acetylase OafA/YrhL